jgi:ubiquinone/menaquinone biosynthesis C-methylase UbiE
MKEMFRHPGVAQFRARERERYDDAYYSQHYWREDLAGVSGNRGLSYQDPNHAERFRFLSDILFHSPDTRNVLDIGCGPGLLLEQALLQGIDIYGIDVSDRALRAFHDRVDQSWWSRFLVSEIISIPFPTNSIDLCLCLDVLEHVIVFDIFSAVSEICRVCRSEIVCSINLDNPYQFHPTILSRESWIAVFESSGIVRYEPEEVDRLQSLADRFRPEYEFFVFRKTN